ncbi:MAG: single-stranded DNA-binding protein, partial [Bdellovibrionales bacterium]|nr:single-stranded DNA-binding protein [Bdellovibrionales bacterium]
MGVNKAFLLGNLGADPELRYTGSQTPVCTINLATGERRKNQEGEWVDHTEWHNVVVWGKQAENCSRFLSKGRQVFIEGRIQTRKWQDKEGRDRYTTEIVASNVQFVGGGKGDASGLAGNIQQSSSGGSPMPPAEPAGVSFDDDD